MSNTAPSRRRPGRLGLAGPANPTGLVASAQTDQHKRRPGCVRLYAPSNATGFVTLARTERHQRLPGRVRPETRRSAVFRGARRWRAPSLLGVLALLAAVGCGEGDFVVSNDSYEPRIVIEGFLQPGPGPHRVQIWRNFPPDADLLGMDLVPDDTRATIIREQGGAEYDLTFHGGPALTDNYFEYAGEDLVIEHGKSYSLDVRATIEGEALHAWATTTVPREGFRIVGVNHPQLVYRPFDEAGQIVNFEFTIDRDPETRLYLATMRPAPGVADPANFVYDNPYTEQDPEDVLEDLADFSYSYDWIQNVPPGPGQSTFELFWFFFWFYGEHEITVYAADHNYQRFLQTFDNVQEDDGNFHEADFAVEGDGIGVFGSVVMDKIRVEVLR